MNEPHSAADGWSATAYEGGGLVPFWGFTILPVHSARPVGVAPRIDVLWLQPPKIQERFFSHFNGFIRLPQPASPHREAVTETCRYTHVRFQLQQQAQSPRRPTSPVGGLPSGRRDVPRSPRARALPSASPRNFLLAVKSVNEMYSYTREVLPRTTHKAAPCSCARAASTRPSRRCGRP